MSRTNFLTKNLLSATLAGLTFLALPAHAAHDLPAGDVGSPVPSPFPANFSAATPLAWSSSTVTAAGGAYTGIFASAVYANTATANDALNAGFTAGTAVLDFVYQFTNLPQSLTSIHRLSLFNLAADSMPNGLSILAWDQASDPDGAGALFTTGQQAADNAERDSTGRTVSFNYGDTMLANKIDPGESSYAILLRVNTTEYSSGYFSSIDGTSATAHAYIPAPIPEPETYALLIAGLGVIGFVARRRKLG